MLSTGGPPVTPDSAGRRSALVAAEAAAVEEGDVLAAVDAPDGPLRGVVVGNIGSPEEQHEEEDESGSVIMSATINPQLGMSKVYILDKYFNELQKFWDTEKRLQGKN